MGTLVLSSEDEDDKVKPKTNVAGKGKHRAFSDSSSSEDGDEEADELDEDVPTSTSRLPLNPKPKRKPPDHPAANVLPVALLEIAVDKLINDSSIQGAERITMINKFKKEALELGLDWDKNYSKPFAIKVRRKPLNAGNGGAGVGVDGTEGGRKKKEKEVGPKRKYGR